MVANCEQFANDAATLLAVDASTTDLNITVFSVVLFPALPPFRIMIDNEIMMVTGIAGNVFTVTRGLEETVIEAHSTGSLVSGVFTNSSFFAFSECRFATGPRSARPAPELDGRLYLTETPGWYLFRENGVSWRAWGPIFQINEVMDFEDDSWSWINVNDGVNDPASLTEWFGDLNFFTPVSAGAGENIRLFTQLANVATPIAPPYSVTVAFSPLLAPVNQTCCGIVFRDSGTDEFIIFRLMYDNTSITKRDLVISLDKYDDPNAFNSNYKVLSAGTLLSPMVFFKMEDDGVNLNWYFSNDGFNFMLFDTQLRTDFLSDPDEIGIGFGTNNTTGTAGMNLHSWLKA